MKVASSVASSRETAVPGKGVGETSPSPRKLTDRLRVDMC
jgi:hypothetical protein